VLIAKGDCNLIDAWVEGSTNELPTINTKTKNKVFLIADVFKGYKKADYLKNNSVWQ
jgi:hypothetical protein